MGDSQSNSEGNASGGGLLFLENSSSTNETSDSSQFDHDSSTSVDHIEARQSVSLPRQRQQGKDLNQMPIFAASPIRNNSFTNRGNDCVNRNEEKGQGQLQLMMETGEYHTAAENSRPVKGNDSNLRDPGTVGARSRFSSRSPRRRKGGNRCEEGNLGNKIHDEENLSLAQTRGREVEMRKGRSGRNHSGDDLHRMIRNLESRFSAVESVTKDLHQMLRDALNNSMLP